MLFRSLQALRARGPPLVRHMAGNPTAAELGLKGWQVYFNTFTTEGRRNIVIGTYGTFFALILLYKSRKSKAQAPEEKTV